MWAIGELGLAHERIDVGGPYGGLDTAEFRAINPHGKVPAVRFDDGVTMFESNAIVRRLALSDPERRLWPSEGQASADADMWAEWAHIAVAFHVTLTFWAVVRTRPSERDPAAIAQHLRFVHEGFATAENVLQTQPFLAGQTLTIADIVFGHVLFRYHTMEIERPPFPAVRAYYDRMTARDAYATHVMVNYDSLRPPE